MLAFSCFDTVVWVVGIRFCRENLRVGMVVLVMILLEL